MKQASLFIVRSPLQLFNCVEASKRYADCDTRFLLILFRKEIDKQLMEQVVAEADVTWDEIILGDIRSNLKQIALVYSLWCRLKRVRTCFVGDSTRIVNFLLNKIATEKFVLVDDGASTFWRAMWVATRQYMVQDRYQKAIPRLWQVGSRLLSVDTAFLGKASFFTMYENIRAYSDKLEIVYNDYRHFKQRTVDLPIKNEIFFIGCDIKRYVLNDPDKFEKYLAAMASYYTGRKITYIFHRKENESVAQREYMEGLAAKYGFGTVIFERILEQQILYQGWIPEEIATFYSSALDTLCSIYAPKATVFKLRTEDVKETSKFELAEMLRHYSDMGVKIIDV